MSLGKLLIQPPPKPSGWQKQEIMTTKMGKITWRFSRSLIACKWNWRREISAGIFKYGLEEHPKQELIINVCIFTSIRIFTFSHTGKYVHTLHRQCFPTISAHTAGLISSVCIFFCQHLRVHISVSPLSWLARSLADNRAGSEALWHPAGPLVPVQGGGRQHPRDQRFHHAEPTRSLQQR